MRKVNPARVLFLIGFMGSGKTTLGRAIPQRMRERGIDPVNFADLDDEVEKAAGMTVAEIFRTCGEEGFRRLESETLKALVRRGGMIIACGGGTPCRPENMELMNSCGTTVLLEAGTDVLVRRLMEAPAGQRPLLNGLKGAAEVETYVVRTIAARSPHYSKATHRFDSSHLETVEEVRDAADRMIDTFLL